MRTKVYVTACMWYHMSCIARQKLNSLYYMHYSAHSSPLPVWHAFFRRSSMLKSVRKVQSMSNNNNVVTCDRRRQTYNLLTYSNLAACELCLRLTAKAIRVARQPWSRMNRPGNASSRAELELRQKVQSWLEVRVKAPRTLGNTKKYKTHLLDIFNRAAHA